jgi:hypothetical protein
MWLAYRRASHLHRLRRGAHVRLVVGTMRTDDKVIRLVRHELPRISVEVVGSNSDATGKWVRALRDGNPLGDELLLGVPT